MRKAKVFMKLQSELLTGHENPGSEVSNSTSKKQKKVIAKDKLGNQSAKQRGSKHSSYKEKIKDIALENDEWNEEEDNLLFNDELDNIGDDEARKREKIRLSAKMTRKRRKIYIEQLEKKIRAVSDELAQSKFRILTFEQSYQKALPTAAAATTTTKASPDIMGQLHQERQKLFDKLEEKIKEKDEGEIEYIMDSMRLRLGLAGKTRTLALNSFFDEIVRLIMPFHMKYLIWIAQENLDIFDAQRRDSESQDSGWFSNSKLSEETIADVKRRITDSKVRYDELLYSMDAVKTQIAQLNEFSQNFIDDLRNFFPPSNIAKFLIELDKKRDLYERNNLYPGSLWQELSRQQKDQKNQNGVAINNNTAATNITLFTSNNSQKLLESGAHSGQSQDDHLKHLQQQPLLSASPPQQPLIFETHQMQQQHSLQFNPSTQSFSSNQQYQEKSQIQISNNNNSHNILHQGKLPQKQAQNQSIHQQQMQNHQQQQQQQQYQQQQHQTLIYPNEHDPHHAQFQQRIPNSQEDNNSKMEQQPLTQTHEIMNSEYNQYPEFEIYTNFCNDDSVQFIVTGFPQYSHSNLLGNTNINKNNNNIHIDRPMHNQGQKFINSGGTSAQPTFDNNFEKNQYQNRQQQLLQQQIKKEKSIVGLGTPPDSPSNLFQYPNNY